MLPFGIPRDPQGPCQSLCGIPRDPEGLPLWKPEGFLGIPSGFLAKSLKATLSRGEVASLRLCYGTCIYLSAARQPKQFAFLGIPRASLFGTPRGPTVSRSFPFEALEASSSCLACPGAFPAGARVGYVHDAHRIVLLAVRFLGMVSTVGCWGWLG